MDRRSFFLSLIGGVAAASVGGVAMVEAAQRKLDTMPLDVVPAGQPAAKTLDDVDAEFSQYRRRGRRYRRMGYRSRMNMRRARRMDRRARPNSQR